MHREANRSLPSDGASAAKRRDADDPIPIGASSSECVASPCSVTGGRGTPIWRRIVMERLRNETPAGSRSWARGRLRIGLSPTNDTVRLAARRMPVDQVSFPRGAVFTTLSWRCAYVCGGAVVGKRAAMRGPILRGMSSHKTVWNRWPGIVAALVVTAKNRVCARQE